MEVMAKQVLDIRAGKGMTTSQSNEFLRNANGGERLKRWSGNYDSTREHLFCHNFHCLSAWTKGFLGTFPKPNRLPRLAARSRQEIGR